MPSEDQAMDLITESPLRNRESSSFKGYVKCKTCSCCCCLTWVGLLIGLLVTVLILKAIVLATAGWIGYMMLPAGLSIVSTNYAMGVDPSKKQPAIDVGANIIMTARYRGDSMDDHLRVYRFSIQHEDWAEPKMIRYWDTGARILYRPDVAGAYTVMVETGFRLQYIPTVDHDWTPYATTLSVESTTVSFSATGIVGTTVMSPLTATPTLRPLDFMNLGVRYALPPINVETLSALYLAASGEDTDDFCMRVHYKRVTEAGDHPSTWQTATCNEITAGQPTYMTVVGMMAETEYQLRHDYVRVPRPQPQDADFDWTLSSGVVFTEPEDDCVSIHGMQGGQAVTFTTDKIPKEARKRLSPYIMRPEYVENSNSPTSEKEGYMMQAHLAMGFGRLGLPSATDMNGNYVYYMPYYKGAYMSGDGNSGMFTRVSGKGTWFLWAQGTTSLNPDLSQPSLAQIWAEVDLEGVPLWVMTVYEVNDLMHEAGVHMIADVLGHHDTVRTPDGRTLIMGGYSSIDFNVEQEHYTNLDWFSLNKERKSPPTVETAQAVGEEHYDFVVEFGKDRSFTKAWKSKDHVDETLEWCHENSFISVSYDLSTMSLEPIYYGDSALDRTHANTLHIDPVDGNLWISLRHFDTVAKIDWQTGEQMYSLKDFALFDADYEPYVLDYDNNVSFFTHQHCPETYEVAGRPDLKLMSIFDNNNTPVFTHGSARHSFGTLALINEALQEAIILRKKELPTYCASLGTSQVLANGNTWYHCGRHESVKGWKDPFGDSSTVYEISPAGDIVYSAGCDLASYRVFRLSSLYGGTDYTPVSADYTSSLPIPAAWDV